MKDLKLLLFGFILLGVGLTGGYWLATQHAPAASSSAPEASAADDQPKELWTCGMHPHVLQEEPGFCPICEMALTPMDLDGASMDSAATDPSGMDHSGHDHAMTSAVSEASAAEWACPDHPSMTDDGPGECPIDGLELVQVESSAPPPASAPPAVSDRSQGLDAQSMTVTIDPSVVQNMNVRTAVVERRDLSRPIRTVGSLDYDQERMVTVTTKYAGWVEKVHVNYVGERVRAGQPLFEVYAPELVQTEQELLSALDFAEGMQSAPDDARRRAEALVDAARTRLSYWDISEEQIRELEASGEVFRTLTVTAPTSGVVMKRMAGLEGMAVNPGMEIFHLADLRNLWLSVEIFEDQLAWIREGSRAEISLSYFPGKTFEGTVRYIEPAFSEKTRTLRAQILVPNRDRELRKGMFATVDFSPLAVEDALAVPSGAVLRTGRRNVVVVDLGQGRFVPREVVLGHETGDYAEILDGVGEGDRVVTSAQFLLDSESTLREAVRDMVAAKMGHAH